MKKILINFAHPAKSRSSVNKALRNAVVGLEGVTVNDLYQTYPDFMIDVEREKKLCEEHDVIIFQHPLYWYSTPSIVKEWFDLVLEHDWAYGSKGTALEGKLFFQVISTGADGDSYQKEGFNEFTLTELSAPFRATAKLCKLVWLPPFAITGVHGGLPSAEILRHGENYQRTIIALRDERVDIEQAKRLELLNIDLNQLIGSE
ncbi:NAD(P)H-dependent oxidoreductase [Marinomonas pollencensis]|uniref:Kef-type potassium/proton antiporter accessory protein (CPA2 family) n=1 Tax=Marinomonas pollencensis TaxID=491954 RepID=A0A3E0DU26_9GAMM|nr:NAD(P)H-dependent oxidoreductase [Marinomonas pollencensis]REG85642.1 Kef-type potassium/proton antiporter accessory protein (CPA2 family) [Marinomonas pollencensis]